MGDTREQVKKILGEKFKPDADNDYDYDRPELDAVLTVVFDKDQKVRQMIYESKSSSATGLPNELRT